MRGPKSAIGWTLKCGDDQVKLMGKEVNKSEKKKRDSGDDGMNGRVGWK